MSSSNFIRQNSNYEELLCYKKSICVYDTLSPFSPSFYKRHPLTNLRLSECNTKFI